jgi:MHS family proline/betaine transporter-like MFS transporter
MSWYVHPLKLVKIKIAMFSVVICIVPYFLSSIETTQDLLLLQVITILFALSYSSAMPIFYKHFPVFKRFTCASFAYALSRALTYVITSFGMVYFVKCFGNYGVLVIIMPVVVGMTFGILHFEKLEAAGKANNSYHGSSMKQHLA